MANLVELVKSNKYIDHINFSGMNFTKKQIFELAEILKEADFLCGLHLSDNGISVDTEFFYEYLDLF